MKKVNLFVIGAMKSGSTTLHYYLEDHPEIFMSDPKEPWFFVKEKNWSKGEDWYHSLFASVPGHVKIMGESSADYTMMPKYQGVPRRIASYNPDARFIYILRDPVIRSISHYWHNVRWHREQRDMITAVQEDPDLMNFSNYSLQLATFLEYFPLERFYVLTFEEMLSNPQVSLSKLYQWLGVDSAFSPPSLERAKNVTPQTIQMVRGFGVLDKFRHSVFWKTTHRFVPRFCKNFGTQLATREISRDDQRTEDVIRFLRPQLQEKLLPLQSLFNRSFSEWNTLYPIQNK